MGYKGINPKEQDDASKVLGKLIANNMESLNSKSFTPGNIVLFSYPRAKYSDKVWDKVPLSLILDTSGTHILGLNLHWVPLPVRQIIIKAIFKLNSQRIKRNQSILITYQQVRPILNRLGVLDKAIHLYLANRVVRRGLVIPPSEILEVIKVSRPIFTKSFEYAKMYKKQAKGVGKYRKTRKRRDSVTSGVKKSNFVRM